MAEGNVAADQLRLFIERIERLEEEKKGIADDIRDVFKQSAAEEVIHQRESALRLVESIGGLALDVTTQSLGPKLLESYLRVKERGLL